MAANGKIITKISSLYNSLTKTEKRIADVLLAKPRLLEQASLAQIAEILDVGEATFIRFCRTLGFKGFADFRLDLAIELATQQQTDNTLLDTEISADDDVKNIGLKLQSSINLVVSETIHLLDFDELAKVVQAILSAKRIFIFGVGSSGISAEWAKNKFMRIGLQVDAQTNNHFMYMQAALMQQDDVVLGISHSGNSQEIVHSLKVARQAGAKTVALTHHLRSPITTVADFVLINGNHQGELRGDSIGTKIAQLFVLDLIYTLIVQEREDIAVTNKQKTLNAMLDQKMK